MCECIQPTSDAQHYRHGLDEVRVALEPVENQARGCRADKDSHGHNGEDKGNKLVVDGQATGQVEQGGSDDRDGTPLETAGY